MSPAALGHVSIEVRDPERSFSFYEPFLTRLGFRRFARERDYLGYELDRFTFWIVRGDAHRVSRRPISGDEEVVPDHLAFRVESSAELERLQSDLEAREVYPTFRAEPHPEFTRGYVSATWVDPDQCVLEVYAIDLPAARKSPPPRGRRRPALRRKVSPKPATRH